VHKLAHAAAVLSEKVDGDVQDSSLHYPVEVVI